MAVYQCSQCVPTNVPDEMTMEQKKYVAFLVRASEAILAMKEIKESLNLPLIEAKNIALHISTTKGKCHRCSNLLAEYEGNCPKCKRLNLDW